MRVARLQITLLLFAAFCCTAASHVELVDLDCKTFKAHAETTVLESRGFFIQSIAQTIVSFNVQDLSSSKLNLRQHWSRDPDLHGRLGLDGIAADWTCFRSRYNEDFLVVHFYCAHEGAKTCLIAMDGFSSEWTQLFDSHGHRLTNNPEGETLEDERRLEKRDVWRAMFLSTDFDRIIYDFVPGQK